MGGKGQDMGCGAFTVSHILPSQMITICIVRRQVFFRRRCIFVIFTMAYFRLAGFRIGARGSRRFFRGLPLPSSPALSICGTTGLLVPYSSS